MASEWPNCRLDQLAAPVGGSIAIGPFGSRMKADCYVAEGVAVIRGSNLGKGRLLSGDFVFITDEKAAELGNANLKPGDLVFPHRGAIGEVGIVPADGYRYALSTSLMKISLDESRVVPDFLYYFFTSASGRAELLRNASQVGTPGIATPLKSLRECVVPAPPLRHQRSVVQTLRCLDDRIDNLRQTNATLEAIAQALFKSWFVDFDPVRAKAEGREPEGMDAATAVQFPSEFEDSAIGPIPEGWRACTIAEVSDLNASKWTAKKHPGIVKYIDLSGVGRNRIETLAEFTFDAAPSRARNHLREGDTIVGTVRPGNRAYAYIHDPEEGLTGSTGFAVLSPKKPHLSSFVYLAATSDEAIDRLTNLADGAAYPAVRPGIVAGTPCVLPSDSVLAAFAEISVPMLEGIGKNNARAAVLEELRDTLLPRLVSGKLRLPDAEREIEATTA